MNNFEDFYNEHDFLNKFNFKYFLILLITLLWLVVT